MLFNYFTSTCQSILGNDAVGAMAPTEPSNVDDAERVYSCLELLLETIRMHNCILFRINKSWFCYDAALCFSLGSGSGDKWDSHLPERHSAHCIIVIAKNIPPFGDCESIVPGEDKNLLLLPHCSCVAKSGQEHPGSFSAEAVVRGKHSVTKDYGYEYPVSPRDLWEVDQ